MAKPAAAITPFRVHYDDGSHVDVDEATPVAARAAALKKRDGFIKTVKVRKGPSEPLTERASA